MSLVTDDDELRALVYVWLSHATKQYALADALLEHRSACAVLELDAWRPKPAVLHEVGRVMAALRRASIRVVPVWKWPVTLARAWPLSPALLVRGDVGLLSRPAVAVVGARRAHVSAEAWARQVAQNHALRGTLVVSGGARGIDTAAHCGALDAGGKTLAYIGVAADRVYPRHNVRLFARILDSGGALVSEHLPLVTTFKGAHAMRNRLIAAHASCVYVAEADVGSGSLGTAAFAVAAGVPVAVSPPGVGQRRAGLDELLAHGVAIAGFT